MNFHSKHFGLELLVAVTTITKYKIENLFAFNMRCELVNVRGMKMKTTDSLLCVRLKNILLVLIYVAWRQVEQI